MNQAASTIGKEIKSLGFKRKGNSLFFIENKDAFCFLHIECPSSVIYVHFGIFPLYLPPVGFHMNYGWRLNNRYPSLGFLTKDDTEERIHEYCKTLRDIINNDLFSMIRSLSTAEEIGIFLKADDYLAVYTNLYQQKYTEAKKSAKRYMRSLSQSVYTQRLRDEKRKEMEQVILFSKKDAEYLNKMFADWRLKNKRFFIPNA